MLDLREYRTRRVLLADYLPWAGLVAPGVVLNKDSSLQRTCRFRGPNLDSATEIVTHISIIDDAGRLVAAIDGLRCLRVARSESKREGGSTGLYRERWVSLPTPVETLSAEPRELVGFWLILADRGGVGEGNGAASYDEAQAKATGLVVEGHTLMEMLLKK